MSSGSGERFATNALTSLSSDGKPSCANSSAKEWSCVVSLGEALPVRAGCRCEGADVRGMEDLSMHPQRTLDATQDVRFLEWLAQKARCAGGLGAHRIAFLFKARHEDDW